MDKTLSNYFDNLPVRDKHLLLDLIHCHHKLQHIIDDYEILGIGDKKHILKQSRNVDKFHAYMERKINCILYYSPYQYTMTIYPKREAYNDQSN